MAKFKLFGGYDYDEKTIAEDLNQIIEEHPGWRFQNIDSGDGYIYMAVISPEFGKLTREEWNQVVDTKWRLEEKDYEIEEDFFNCNAEELIVKIKQLEVEQKLDEVGEN